MENNENLNNTDNITEPETVSEKSAAEDNAAEAEHVISYRPEDTSVSDVPYTSLRTEETAGNKQKKEKVKKQKRTFGAGFAAVLLIGSIFLSAGFGIFHLWFFVLWNKSITVFFLLPQISKYACCNG